MGGIGFDLSTQLPNKNPEMLRVVHSVRAPDGLQNGAVREDAIRIVREQREQLEFFRRQADVGVATADAPAIKIDGQIAHSNASGFRLVAGEDGRSATRMRATSSSGPKGLVM